MKILYTQKRIAEMVTTLANQVHKAHPKEDIVLVGLLDGAIYLLTDLSRQLEMLGHRVIVQTLRVSSYHNAKKSSGIVTMNCSHVDKIIFAHKSKPIVLVDEMCDSGRTLGCVSKKFTQKGAIDVQTLVLLNKIGIKKHFTPTYAGALCPNSFLVGYGLDYAGNYRALSNICILDEQPDNGWCIIS